jgi:LmbE family N-acetylglucosaminyl deacetylase
MKRLLCVFAHPDDECYGPGGVIAQCALDGGEVFITMFTSGDAGTIGVSKTLSPTELAARRRAEFSASCDALGVTGHRILGVPDGGVNRVDANWAVREIIEDIHKHRPQVVLTFHHLGVSSHPDHIAVAGFLGRAFAETDGPRAYFEWGIPEDRAPLYERANLISIPESEIVARVDIGEAAMERKLGAIRAHVTQYDFFLSLQQKFDYREMATPEHFGLRRSRGPRPGRILTDLWEGLDA